MTLRNRLLIVDSVMPKPFINALERKGITLVDSESDAAADDLRNMLGCIVWFYEGMRSPWRIWQLARRLRRHGIPLFAWNRDAPHYLNRSAWRLNWYNHAKLLDIYATHTLADKRRFANTWLYLPNAADTDNYNLSGISLKDLRNPERYHYDVSFFGAMNGARYKEMRLRQEFFAALADRLQAMGLRFLFREAEGMGVKDQVSLVQHSKINLNFGASCEYLAPFASGLPERCFGIPACGGFLLSDQRTHALNDFTPGHNWAEFVSLDDCVVKIQYWLSHFDEARQLAERCHAHVLTEHTYDRRAEKLIASFEAWHRGKRDRLS